jgi:hypothetical protein
MSSVNTLHFAVREPESLITRSDVCRRLFLWYGTSKLNVENLIIHTQLLFVTIINNLNMFLHHFLNFSAYMPLYYSYISLFEHPTVLPELSSLARKLWSRVRIPLVAWMSVCVYSVLVLSCV